MNIASSPELREIMNEVYYHPAVSIIEPFEPKMVQKARLTHSLEICADKVECILRTSYSVEIVELMMQKIRGIISDLNFCTHKKSIAIYVTPVFEKLLYLDMPVEEKIIIDGSFEIRDVVYNKKQQQQYLVMFLHNRKYSIYWWNNTSFIRIVASSCLSMDLQIRDIPQRTSNFTNAAKVKQTLMDNFLHLIDNSLAQILYSYHLPVFIVGTDKILGHFKKITKHARSIINYIHGNYEDIINNQLQEILKPYTEHWEKVRQQDLLNQLEDAADKKKLAAGICDVWNEASRGKGRLLVVEQTFTSACNGDVIYMPSKPNSKYSYVKDTVDNIIEKVLEHGGDVEFVDRDVLKDFDHIALIQFYK